MRTVRIASDGQSDSSKDHIAMNNRIMTEVKNDLGLTQDVTLKWKKTPTAMARSIMQCLYPDPEPNFILSNIDEVVIQTIISKF